MLNSRQQRRVAFGLLSFAILLAVAIGYFIINIVDRADLKYGVPQTVVVAAIDIPARVLLTPDMFTTIEMPASFIDSSMFTSVEEVLADDVFAVSDILEGVVVQRNVIATNFGLERGERAVSILVDYEANVGNNVRPGSQVDILLTYDEQLPESTEAFRDMRGLLLDSGSVYTEDFQRTLLDELELIQEDLASRRQVTTEMMQAVPVLAVNSFLPDTSLSDAPAIFEVEGETQIRGSVVTLALPPEEAQLLVYASSYGEVHFLLRRFDEPDTPRFPAIRELPNTLSGG